MKLTDDDLAEWRANPVTEHVINSFDAFLLNQEEQCKAAAWAGNPWPDERRQAARLATTLWWDAKQANAKEINEMLGIIDDGETE
jgi:hypothetical protein